MAMRPNRTDDQFPYGVRMYALGVPTGLDVISNPNPAVKQVRLYQLTRTGPSEFHLQLVVLGDPVKSVKAARWWNRARKLNRGGNEMSSSRA